MGIKKLLKKIIPGRIRKKLRSSKFRKKAAGTAVAVAAVLAIAAIGIGCRVYLRREAALEQERIAGEQEENERAEGEEREKAEQEPEEPQVVRELSAEERLLQTLLEEMPEKSAGKAGIRISTAVETSASPEQSSEEASASPERSSGETSASPAPSSGEASDVRAEAGDTELSAAGLVISWFAAPYPSNSGSEYNAKKAAARLNGAVVPAGEEFSYNKRIGERTKENGYVEAPVIMGGKMVQGLGGGICEISSMLYNLCLQSGLEVLERSPHSLLVPYVPGGLDAAVSWGTMDFRFENPYEVPVVLLAGYDDDAKLFEVAAVADGGAALLQGRQYVPVSEKVGELHYETSLEIWQGTVQIGQEKLGENYYMGVDEAE